MQSPSPESLINPKFVPTAAETPPSPLLLGFVVAIVVAIGFSPWLLTRMARETLATPPVVKQVDMTAPSNWSVDAKWHHSHLLQNNFNLINHAQYAAQMQRERKFAKAVEAYTLLIEGTGKFRAQNYTNRGRAYMSLHRYDLAIADFNNAIALDPVEADAFRGRSEAYRELGQTALAQQDMNQSMKLNH